MSMRPLPGASYHTFDAFPYTDLEAVDHFDTPPGYDKGPFDEKNSFDTSHHGYQHLHHARDRRQRRRRYRRPPVLLSLIVLCCLAFVASAFWEYSSNALWLPDVSDRHAPLADRLSSAFQTESRRATVSEHYDSALEIMCVPQFFFFFVCAWACSPALFWVSFRIVIPFSKANCAGNVRDRKIECPSSSSVGCDIDIRHSLLQTFTLE